MLSSWYCAWAEESLSVPFEGEGQTSIAQEILAGPIKLYPLLILVDKK